MSRSSGGGGGARRLMAAINQRRAATVFFFFCASLSCSRFGRRDFLLNQISCGLLKSNGKHMAGLAALASQQGAGLFKPGADRSVFIWDVLFISCSWFGEK